MRQHAIQPYFLIGVLLLSIVLAFYILQPFLAPLALGAIFAVVLHPFYRFLYRRLGNRESVAALATLVVAAICILVPTFILGSQLLKEANGLYASATESGARASFGTLLDSVVIFAEPYVPDMGERVAAFAANLDAYIQQGLGWLIQNLGSAFSSAAGIILDFFIFFVSLYYFLRDGSKLTKVLTELSPLVDSDDAVILHRLSLAVDSVVKGRLTISLIQGFLTGLGFFIFGVPNAVLWGLVATIASIVPPIGTAIVLAPAVAYLVLSGFVPAAIGLALWGSIAVGLVDNLLGPKLMSRGLQLHPLLVLLSVLGGLIFFGPIGIFLGPITMSLLLVLLSLYREASKSVEKQAHSVIE